MKKKSLTINAFLNGIRSILSLLFPIITFPYISHVLSVDGVGIYNFSDTYVGYFMLIASLGINTYAVREGAKYRDDYKKISEFSSQIFTINMLATFVAYFFLFLSLVIFKSLSAYVECILIFSLQILFTTVGTEWIYTIYEEYAYITIRSILFKIISIILLFILVREPSDYLWYAAITVVASVGSNFLNYMHAKSICTIRFIRNISWKQHLKPILVIFASSVAVKIYASSDITFLGLLKGNYEVGIYSIDMKIYILSQSLLTAILVVTIPRLSMLYGKQRFNEYKLILSRLVNTLSVLVLPAVVGLIMISKEVILIIAGEKYIRSVFPLKIIAWAIIFSIFNWIFSSCVLIPSKRENLILKGTIITAIFNIILNIILIPRFSYNGTSLSTVLTEMLSMSLDFYYGRDILKGIFLQKENIKELLISIVGCIYIIFYCTIIRFFSFSVFLNVLLMIFGAVIGYFLILYILGSKIVLSIINRFVKLRG